LTPVKIGIKKGDKVSPIPPAESLNTMSHFACLAGRIGTVERVDSRGITVAFRGLSPRCNAYRKTLFRPEELLVQQELL